ncbi:MAG TPA: hemerythrin domain-containing protein [Candidatus Solibacter sp.]|nr:hemerythrin domain-containing protein [Candidatus Solibacter sp.]
MESRDSNEYIQREHLEIVRLADKFAEALALTSSKNFEARQKGLAELRALRPGLLGISQHCREEDSILETDFRHYLDAEQYDKLQREHQSITRLVGCLLRELPYVTADSASDLCPTGEELLEQIHEHIAYEQDMLWRVEGRRLQYQ